MSFINPDLHRRFKTFRSAAASLHRDERGNYIAEAVIILSVSVVGAYGLLAGVQWFIERFAERANELEAASG